jgi:hypothetical protein
MSANTTRTPDIHATARALARPVVRGWMARHHANSALILAAMDEQASAGWERVLDTAKLLQWEMSQEIRNQQIVREITQQRVSRIAWQMLRAGKPRNAVLAEAHTINGDAGFPLAEKEVTAVVADAEQGVRRNG